MKFCGASKDAINNVQLARKKSPFPQNIIKIKIFPKKYRLLIEITDIIIIIIIINFFIRTYRRNTSIVQL